jgi:uncharacterized membrane protein
MTTTAPPSHGRLRRSSPLLLAGVLGGAGVLHFAIPKPYETIVPGFLGNPRAWVYGSGVAELLCAAGVLLGKTRTRGALASAALFVAVFPANLQMALDSGGGKPGLAHNPALAWGRLPLQIPLILWALSVARAARPEDEN